MAKPHPMLGPDIRVQDSGGSCGTPTGAPGNSVRSIGQNILRPVSVNVGWEHNQSLLCDCMLEDSDPAGTQPSLAWDPRSILREDSMSRSLAVSNVALGSLSASLPCRGVPCTDEDSRSVSPVSRLRAPMHGPVCDADPRSGTVGGGIGDKRYRTPRGVRHRASPRLGPLSSVRYRVPVGRREWLWRRCRRGP